MFCIIVKKRPSMAGIRLENVPVESVYNEANDQLESFSDVPYRFYGRQLLPMASLLPRSALLLPKALLPLPMSVLMLPVAVLLLLQALLLLLPLLLLFRWETLLLPRAALPQAVALLLPRVLLLPGTTWGTRLCCMRSSPQTRH